MSSSALTARSRIAVLLAAIGGLVFDGVELGLMPVASLSVSQDLLGTGYTPALGGDWFARFTAALMLGAAWAASGPTPWRWRRSAGRTSLDPWWPG